MSCKIVVQLTKDQVFDVEHAVTQVFEDFQNACSEGWRDDVLAALEALVMVAATQHGEVMKLSD